MLNDIHNKRNIQAFELDRNDLFMEKEY
jgi:hypothetical protein